MNSVLEFILVALLAWIGKFSDPASPHACLGATAHIVTPLSV